MYNHTAFDADQVTEKAIAEVKATVESGDTNLNDLRGIWKEGTNTECPLSDDELIFMVAGVNDDLDPKDWLAVMQSRATGDDEADEADEQEEKKEAPTVDKWKDASMERDAKAFSKNLDDEFIATSFDIQEADEKSKRGIAIMLWNQQQKWDQEVWDTIPDLDVTQKEADEKKLNVKLSRWRYKDGNRTKVKDWFEIAFTNTGKGRDLVTMIDDLKAAKGDEVKTPVQLEFAKMGDTRLDALLKGKEKSLLNMVRRFKRMVRLKRLIDACNDLSPTIRAELLEDLDKDGDPVGLVMTVECLAISQINKKGSVVKINSMEPNTFLRLDPEKAKEDKDNTPYDALLKTKDRAPKPPGDSDFVVPTSPEKYIASLNSQAHYYEEASNFEAFQKYFATLADPSDQYEICTTIEETHMKVGAIWTFLKPTYEKLEAARKAAKDKEKENTIKKNAELLKKTG